MRIRRSSGSRIATVAVCLFVMALADTGLAGAQEPDRGLFTVNPPRRELRAEPPAELGTTTLGNTTRRTLSVRVFPTLLGQSLDGTFTVLEKPAELRAARRLVSATPRRFELGTGEARQIASRWTRVPRGDRAAYVALVFEGTPPGPAATGIRTIVRLSQPNLLELPGAEARSGTLSGLRVEPGTRDELIFYPRVRNDGDAAASPRDTRLRVEDAAGESLVDRPWPAGPPVLPGAEVEYPLEVAKILPAGDYTARASMRFGRSSKVRTRNLRFTLTGPNELPVTKFDLKSIRAAGEVGGSATITAELENTGTASGAAELEATLREAAGGGGGPLAGETEETGEVAPGETITAEVEVGELAGHDYRARVIARSEGGGSDRLETTFTPSPARSSAAKAWDFLTDNLLWLLGIVALAAIALIVWRYRRLQDRLAYLEMKRREDQGE